MFRLKSIFMWFSFLVVLLLGFSACGVSSSDNNSSENSNSTSISDLDGLITLEEYDNISNVRRGIYSFKLVNGKVDKEEGNLTQDGLLASSNSKEHILFTHYCKGAFTEILLYDLSNYTLTTLTPCSNKLQNYRRSLTYFEQARLSPNKSNIAVEVRIPGYSGEEDSYVTTIYDLTKNEIKRYHGFKNPVWLSDGRLLLKPEGFDAPSEGGMYIVGKGFSENPVSINVDSVRRDSNDIQVSPLSEKITYLSLGRIWTMKIDGTDKQTLPIPHTDIGYFVFSPNEKYIAYIRQDNSMNGDYYGTLYFYEIKTKKILELGFEEIVNPDAHGTFFGKSIVGPISWTK